MLRAGKEAATLMRGGGISVGAPRKEWLNAQEAIGLGARSLPASVQGFNQMAVASGWRADPARARQAGRRGWEYHLSLFPPDAQVRAHLVYRQQFAAPIQDEASKARWARFEALPAKQKVEARRRLQALEKVETLKRAGRTSTAAAALAAREFNASSATIFNWQRLVAGLSRADWLAALAPGYRPTASYADCHPEAWEAIKSAYLQPEGPKFSSCYRWVCEAAQREGWQPIPSERSLRRRLDAEVPRAVVTLARKGRDKAKTLYPAQRRVRTHFHAMQAVNADGHKLDVFVRLDDGRVTRVHLIAMQDLYSGMIVAWRLAESENKEAVRLVIGDMVERHGIPEKCWLDNGRAFASKWITGRMSNRYRFQIRDEDPAGILTTLGVEVHWATPYHGQAKPIERAFRDLADEIGKHPFCHGAYTGNRPDAKPENYGNAAIPIAEFRRFVATRIDEHNSRPGRRAASCNGRSFRDTFKASVEDPATIIDWPTEAQKALWLLAAEKVRAQKGSGQIHFFENVYWSRELNQHAGSPVIVRFDPERLHDTIKVYTLDDRFICEAACQAPVGYDDTESARAHARNRSAYSKAVADQLRLARKMSADELARIFYADRPAPELKPMPPRTKRIAAGGAAPAAAPEPDYDFEESFSRGLRLLGDDAEIIPFTPRSNEGG